MIARRFLPALRARLPRLALSLPVIAAAACAESDPTGPGGPPPATLPSVAVIAVSEEQLVAPVGGTAELEAKVLDLAGTPVDVSVEWSSQDGRVATVDPDGVVTAVSIGSTEIHATVRSEAHAGSNSLVASVTVSTVDVAAGVVIVPANTVRENVELLSPADADPADGLDFRIPLSADAPSITVGDRVVSSDWGFYGEVTSVEPSGDGTEISIFSSRLEGFFENARLRHRAGLQDFTFADGLGGAPAALVPGAGFPGSGPAAAGLWDDLVKKLLSGFEFTLDDFSCKPTIESSVAAVTPNITSDSEFLDIELVSDQDVIAGVAQNARYYIDLSFRTHLSGSLEWSESYEGKIECLRVIRAPYKQLGPAVISLPLGAGFTIQAGATSTQAHVTMDGYIDTDLKIGLELSPSQLITPIAESVSDLDNLTVDFEFPDMGAPEALRADMKVEFFGFVIPRAGLGIGTKFGIYKVLDDVRVGARSRSDFAGTVRQARDDAFAASGGISVFAKRTPNDPLFFMRANALLFGFTNLLDALDGLSIIDIEELLSFELDLPVSSSPTGLMVASQLDATVGDTLTFAIDLENETFLGLYQVEQVEISRVSGTGLATTLEVVEAFTPDPGQTHFEWSWVPGESDADDGLVRFVAFATSTLYKTTSFQLDDVLEVGVAAAESSELALEDFFEFGETLVTAAVGKSFTRDEGCIDGSCTAFAAFHEAAVADTVGCGRGVTPISMSGSADIVGTSSGGATTDSVSLVVSAAVNASFEGNSNGLCDTGSRWGAGVNFVTGGKLKVPGPGTIVIRATASGEFTFDDDRPDSPCEIYRCGGSQAIVGVGSARLEIVDAGSDEASMAVPWPQGGEFDFNVYLNGHAGIVQVPDPSFSSSYTGQLSVAVLFFPDGG